MIQLVQKYVLFLLALVTLTALPSSASLDLVGAGVFSNATGTPTVGHKWGLPGGGLVVGMRLGGRVHLEFGGIYLSRLYTQDVDVTARMVSGNLGLRYNLTRAIGLAAGANYNHYISNPAGLAGSDWGLYGGLPLRIRIKGSVSFLLEPMYRYSMRALTFSGGTVTPHEFIGLAGFTIGAVAK